MHTHVQAPWAHISACTTICAHPYEAPCAQLPVCPSHSCPAPAVPSVGAARVRPGSEAGARPPSRPVPGRGTPPAGTRRPRTKRGGGCVRATAPRCSRSPFPRDRGALSTTLPRRGGANPGNPPPRPRPDGTGQAGEPANGGGAPGPPPAAGAQSGRATPRQCRCQPGPSRRCRWRCEARARGCC